VTDEFEATCPKKPCEGKQSACSWIYGNHKVALADLEKKDPHRNFDAPVAARGKKRNGLLISIEKRW